MGLIVRLIELIDCLIGVGVLHDALPLLHEAGGSSSGSIPLTYRLDLAGSVR
jgi:hypothetical protein